MEAENKRVRFTLKPKLFCKKPRGSLAKVRGSDFRMTWERLEQGHAGLDVDIITSFFKKGDGGLGSWNATKNVLPESTGDHVLHYRCICWGNCRCVQAKSKAGDLTVGEILDGKPQPITAGLGDGDERVRGGQENGDLNVTDVLERPEEAEAAKNLPKQKSIRREVLKWLNDITHDYCKKKIAETYRREREEGNQFYPSTFYFFHPMTRADRERQKREIWMERDTQRQNIKNYVDSYWEEKHRKKEARRANKEGGGRPARSTRRAPERRVFQNQSDFTSAADTLT